VLGGLRLNGPAFETVIDPSIEAKKEIDPYYIVPMHFTRDQPDHGGNAKKCILNTIGTTYVL